MTTPISDNYCFVCGQDNPRGLKISVTYREAEMAAETELALPREFQGWADVIHGGILATLLDEMMAHAVWHYAGPGLTLGLEVRFHAPLKPDEPILVRACSTPKPAVAAWPKARSPARPTGSASPRARAGSCCWKKMRGPNSFPAPPFPRRQNAASLDQIISLASYQPASGFRHRRICRGSG